MIIKNDLNIRSKRFIVATASLLNTSEEKVKAYSLRGFIASVLTISVYHCGKAQYSS